MPCLIPKLQEIVMSGSSQCFCETFVYEPANFDEENLGSLYLVGQFDGDEANSGSLLNLLASVIKREFYASFKRKTLCAFEAALKKANLTLADFIESNNIDWTGKIHLVCAAINKKMLYLTQIGKAQACLWRNQELVNVCNNLASLQKNPYPLKAFGSLVSGGLMPADRFVLTTPNLMSVFSKNSLKKMLGLSNLAEASQNIQQEIQKNKPQTSLAALLIEMQLPKKDQSDNVEWGKLTPSVCHPIDFSEIVQETQIRSKATIVPEITTVSAVQNFLHRPKVLGQHYFQKLRKIIRR